MGPMRVVILIVALVAAVVAALLVRNMTKSAQVKAQPAVVASAPQVIEKPTARVLVAKRDLTVGTRLGETDIGWQAWPLEGVQPTYITDSPAAAAEAVKSAGKTATKLAQAATDAVSGPAGPMAALLGSVVRETIYAGEPIVQRKLVHAGAAGVMAISLEPGMRAMAVPLSAESAAGGFILPGDHVDVVQARQVEGAAVKTVVINAVIKNVRVLAIDQATSADPKNAAVIGATATLEVTPPQAEALLQAKSQGELTLLLRSYADSDGPAIITNAAKLAGSLAAPNPSVRVFRNGQSTEVMVAR